MVRLCDYEWYQYIKKLYPYFKSFPVVLQSIIFHESLSDGKFNFCDNFAPPPDAFLY